MKTSFTTLGIDLGGTKTAFGLYDESMHRIVSHVIPTHAHQGYEGVMRTVSEHARTIIRSDTVGIGLGVPGFLDPRTGIVGSMPNIHGAEGKKPAAFLEKDLGIRTVIENDARCFAYGEAMRGAGKGHKIVLGITLGTGVGGGIVVDGKIFHGARGYAGEVGHVLLKPGEPPYPTNDRRGEVEQFLSGTAMGKRCEAAQSPQEYLEGTVCGFMQPQVFREVAWLITNAVHFVDPSIIVFGGSAGRALKPHFPEIHRELMQWILPTVTPPELSVSILEDAALIGAVLLASVSQRD